MDIPGVDLRIEPIDTVSMPVTQNRTAIIIPFRKSLLLHSNPLLFNPHVLNGPGGAAVYDDLYMNEL